MHSNMDFVKTEKLSEQELEWSSLGLCAYIKIFLLAAAVYAVFKVETYTLVIKWMSDSSWSHGFLIPLFSLYFVNQQKKQILSLKPQTNWLGLFLLLCCLAAYVLFVYVYKFGYLKSLTIIPTLAAIVLFIGGWKLLKYTWLPIGYIIFALPLPARIYNDITIPMRKIASIAAAEALNLVRGIEASSNGVVIDVVYKGIRLEPALDVAEACSGMRLLMAFLALGVAMAYLHYRPVWQRLILLASTIPISIFCNIVRVIVTAFIYILWDPKYAQGIYHDALGMLMLPLAFGSYGVIAWFLANLTVDEEKQEQKEQLVIRRKEHQEGGQ